MVVHSRYIHGAGKPNHPSVSFKYHRPSCPELFLARLLEYAF